MLGIDEQGIHILAFTLRWYGIILVASAWIAAEVATLLAARNGRDPKHVWQGLIWVSLGGLIGARLWFILFPPDSIVANGRTAGWFLTHFFDLNQGAIAVWTGGLGLIGGLIGGVFGLLAYTRRQGIPLLPWLDIAACVLPLAQALARWANATNQELYGPPTDLPWAILVSDANQRVGPYTDLARYPLATTRFHPVFLYESAWSVAVFVVLLVLYVRLRDRLRPGSVALLYVGLYGVGRFLLEFLRINVSHVAGVNVSQIAAGVAAALAIVALFGRRHTNVLRPPGNSSFTIRSSIDDPSQPVGR